MEPDSGEPLEEEQCGVIFPLQCANVVARRHIVLLLRGGSSTGPPPARSASKESLLSAGRSTTSPALPGDDGGEQDRSSPWSGFDDELPPNQEARPATPPPRLLTPQPPPESAPGPSSLPLLTQPPSDPTLALLMNMMSTFQSEMKSLRSDLSGSVSSMVAEAVAAQLPQLFIIPLVQALLNFCRIILAILLLHVMALFPSSPCPVVPNFGVSLFYQALPNPAPPAMPPHPTLPMAKEPTRVPQPGSSGPHRSQVLVSHSVLPHCAHMSYCYMLIYLPYSVPYCCYTTFLPTHWFLRPTFLCLLGDRGW